MNRLTARLAVLLAAAVALIVVAVVAVNCGSDSDPAVTPPPVVATATLTSAATAEPTLTAAPEPTPTATPEPTPTATPEPTPTATPTPTPDDTRDGLNRWRIGRGAGRSAYRAALRGPDAAVQGAIPPDSAAGSPARAIPDAPLP